MSVGELALHILQCETHLLVEHQKVIYKVASLVQVTLLVAIDGLNYRFHSLFAHLLRNLVHTLVEQVSGI